MILAGIFRRFRGYTERALERHAISGRCGTPLPKE
jgi:hypothetical protein